MGLVSFQYRGVRLSVTESGGWSAPKMSGAIDNVTFNAAVDSVDAMFADTPPPDRFTCSVCGGYQLLVLTSDSHFRRLSGLGECSECQHYLELQRFHHDDLVVDDGRCYAISKVTGGIQGFGGQRFLIDYNDGREVYTTNLWYCGTVPAHLRARILDTAKLRSAPIIKEKNNDAAN